ncbi:extracellular calcium-sensing receptor-like [Stylophora pistillata]|uniref:extracellular calcium-sensing receptor-like n=1 Tax=Stylophora pistillata TaxID=50429 RepID=UPI000C0523A9|nr:extracellular calcium-sensing receptor-like [Stylophora pistillata]
MGKKFHQRPFKITDLFGNDFSMCKQMVPLHLILLWAALQFEPGSCYPRRFHRPGNVTLGVILPLHVKNSEDKCGEFYPRGLGFIEAITFAIDRINNDTNLLPNVTLGFDIRDYCDTPVLAMSTAYDFVKSNYLNELPVIGLDNLTDPISAVIGAEDSSSSTLISSLLQVVGIPTMSPLSTSEELSSPYFSTFFRTIPPDGEQAKAMVDIIEHYGWTYIAAVAIDNSYGRYGLRALEREAYDRRTFCVAFSEYFTYSTRHLPENFNEARYIGFAMNVLLISWVSFYPVDSSLEGYYTTIVACATALVTAYGLLLCIFAPKLFVIVLHPEQNTHEFMKAQIGQFTSSVSQVKMTVQPASGIENDSCCSTT